MKKLGIYAGHFLASFFCILCLVVKTWAIPYSLNFDPDGDSAAAGAEEIYGFDAEAIAQYSLPNSSDKNDVVVRQYLGDDNILNNGDRFIEVFVLNILNGLDEDLNADPYGGYYNAILKPDYALYIQVFLEGYITDYSSGSGPDTTLDNPENIEDDEYKVFFDGGYAIMFLNDEDNDSELVDYDEGVDVFVARFEFDSAEPIIMTPSVFSGKAAQTNLAFVFTNYNESFFPSNSEIENLVDSRMLLALTEDTVYYRDVGADSESLLLAYNFSGMDIKFEALPEPATIILLGTGLIVCAVVVRCKCNR